jgi:hypothetical protein
MRSFARRERQALHPTERGKSRQKAGEAAVRLSVSNDIREAMQETARAVQARLPPGTGFIVLAFDFTRPEYKGRMAMEYV